jgi:hypothetical protein
MYIYIYIYIKEERLNLKLIILGFTLRSYQKQNKPNLWEGKETLKKRARISEIENSREISTKTKSGSLRVLIKMINF